jgi:putative modified peptide
MSFQLPVPIVDKLLDLLSSDDAFRARFANDARDALAFLGYAPAANPAIIEGAWWCLKVELLASKEVIRQGRQQLRRQFTADFLPQIPFALDSKLQVQAKAA